MAGADFEAAKEAACQHSAVIGARFVDQGAEPAIVEGAILAGPAAFAGQRTATIFIGRSITLRDLHRSVHTCV